MAYAVIIITLLFVLFAWSILSSPLVSDAERLSDIAVEIDGMKESFEDEQKLSDVVEILHDIAHRHNPENYTDS